MNLLIVTQKEFGLLASDSPHTFDDLPLFYRRTIQRCDLVVYRESADKNHIMKDRLGESGTMDDVELLVLLADEMAKEEVYVEESSSNIVAHSSLIGFVNQRDPNEC